MADVIVVGGGLTGGTLSCALAEKGLEVALVDQVDPAAPMLSDGRSFGLSRSSYNILSKLSIWPNEATPITKIRISDGLLPRSAEYHEGDVRGGPLGYVVDSALLKTRILEKVLSFKNIRLYAPTTVIRLERTESYALIETHHGETLRSPLCIAADGKFSELRTWAQIPLVQWAYHQNAIVCNMAHTLPHNNQAFEHFLPSGPLAFVPRPGKESGLAWSIDKKRLMFF